MKDNRFKDVIPYLFFGVCTTMTNIVVYWLCSHVLHLGTMPSTVTAWIISVLFAYITNRKWVFRSTAESFSEILRELSEFFLCRLATGFVDWGCMYIFAEKMGLNDVMIKTLANVLVIILNYIASKLIIFNKS